MIRGYRAFAVTSEGLVGSHALTWNKPEMRAACKVHSFRSPNEKQINPRFTRKQDFKRARKHLLEPDGQRPRLYEYSDSCACGIYIARSVDELIRQGYLSYMFGTLGVVAAAVIGWGATVEYEKCWRVEFARVEHIWASPENSVDDHRGRVRFHDAKDTLERNLQSFGVPYDFVDSWADLSALVDDKEKAMT